MKILIKAVEVYLAKEASAIKPTESDSYALADKNAREEAMREKGINNKGRPRLSEDKKDQVVLMYNNGYPLKEIAKSIDVSLSTVCKVIRERKK